MRALPALVLGAALGVSGCTAHRVETPSAAPKTATAKPQAPPVATAKPPGMGSPGSPAPAAIPSETAAPKPLEEKAPPATESSYVYAPQQAAVASHPAPALPGGSAKPPAGAPREAAPAGAPADVGEAANEGPGQIQLSVVASAAEIATGSIMTVDVMAASNRAVVDAPLHLTFDPNVVEFVDGTVGDFLAQGGSSVVFFADGRSRPGDVAVAAGRVERAQGAKGSGLLCRVRFRGTAAGTTPLSVGRAKAWGVNGEELTVLSGGTTAVVR